MADTDARAALYDAIVSIAKEGGKRGGPSGAAMVREAAVAFRAVTGGAQPGNVIVESK